AKSLAARGAAVLIADLDEAAVHAAAAGVHDTRAVGIAADVTDRGAMQRAVAGAVERFGGLDLVVANAGIAARVATFRAMSPETFERVLDVNLMGVYRTVEAALPEIVRRRGHVVVISSIYAFTNGAGEVPYAMSKAAVEQFGRALRAELAQHGASASVAYFGFIDTEMVRRALDADPLADRMLQTLPGPLHKRAPPSVAGEAIAPELSAKRLAGTFPGDLGIELIEISDARVRGRMRVDRRHLHPAGYVHGGAWVAFADTVAAWGTLRHLPEGRGFTTVELKINVLASAGEGDELTAVGEPLHVGARTHVWQVKVFRGERLAAHFVCTQIVL